MRKDLRRAVFLLGSWLAATLCFAQTAPVSPPTAQNPDEIIEFLSKVVAWHRQITVEQPVAQASDLGTVQENRRAADQVVQLSVEYGRSQVPAPVQAQGPTNAQPPDDSG